MTGRLEGKVALVTGGGSGIGRAAAKIFAREKARVIIADRSIDDGEKTVHMISDAYGEATFIKADVSKATEVEALINKIVKVHNRLDCAFNNAGVAPDEVPTHEYSEYSWDRIISINLKGVWLCMKYEIPIMLKQGSGTIVNNSSAVGLVGAVNTSAYCASKHGVIGLTKTAALEYAKAGIRINAVCPAFTQTPLTDELLENHAIREAVIAMHPIGRLGYPEEIAEAVIWLSSEASSFVTGIAMAVDGGLVAQ